MKYPKYERYKDSGSKYINELPDYWITSAIKYLVSTPITDGPHETPDFLEDGIPFISAEAIENGRINFNKKRDCISEEQHKIYSKKYKPQRNDVYVVKSGSTTGKVAIVDTDEEFNIWSPLAAIRVNPEENDPYFLFYALSSDLFQKQVSLFWSFGTQPNIGMSVLQKLKIPTPPLKEQQSIANFLDKETTRLDALIAKKQQLIETLKEKRIAVISQAVTKGLNPEVPTKDTGIEWLGAVPEGWGVKRLKYLSVINPVASEIKHLELSDEVSFVPMESISENGGMKTDKTKELEAVRQGYTYFKEEDVVIAKITPCFENGKGSIAQNLVNNIGFGTTELHVVRCNPEHLDFKYFFYITNTHQFLKLGESEMFGAGGQKRVPTEFVKNYPIAYPIDMKEQRRIIQFLDKYVGQILSIIDRTQKTISKLQEYKTALISAAVTGKIKVPEQA